MKTSDALALIYALAIVAAIIAVVLDLFVWRP